MTLPRIPGDLDDDGPRIRLRPTTPMTVPTIQDEPESRPGGIPLYVWVIAAVLIAIPVGRVLGRRGGRDWTCCPS